MKRDANCRRTRHVTRDRGALAHDDRIDALAGAVVPFQRAMMMDVDQAAKAMKEAEIEAEVEDFPKASISPPTAACGSIGSGWRCRALPMRCSAKTSIG